MPAVLLIAALLLLLGAPSQATTTPAGDIECRMTLYLFVDVSASLSGAEQDRLGEGLAQVLSGSLFQERRTVYLVPFAEKMPQFPRSFENPTTSEIKAELRRQFEYKTGVGDPNRTDLRQVFDFIKAKIEVHNQYEVFIVASDFEHDLTNDRSSAALREHKENWIDYWAEKGKFLKDKFSSSPSRGALLLLEMATSSRTTVSETVLGDLRPLAPEGGQVKPFQPSPGQRFDASSFLAYVKPVRLSVKRSGSLQSGSMRVDVNAFNLTCLNLQNLYYSLAIDAGRKHVVEVKAPMQALPGNHWSASRVIPESTLQAVQQERLHVEDLGIVVDAFPSPASAEEDFVGYSERQLQDYIFLEHLKGEPGLLSQELHLELTFRGELEGRKRVTLEFHHGDRLIGKKNVYVEPYDLNKGGPIRPVDVKIEDLPAVCASDEKPILKLWGDSEFLVQYNESLPLDNRNLHNHPTRELVEGVFEQASLPALITLLFTLLLLFRKVSFDLGRVEELVAVIAVGATTTVVILHALTSAEYFIDKLLMDQAARWIGALALLFSAVLLARLLQTGALPLPVSDEEMASSLAIEEAHARRRLSPDRTRAGRLWHRFRCPAWRICLILFICVAGLAGSWFVLSDTKEKVDCWLVFSDDLTAHRSR
ncbi:MAG: hypothetical protein ABUT39_27345 [Acidobacteriota bacterium]